MLSRRRWKLSAALIAPALLATAYGAATLTAPVFSDTRLDIVQANIPQDQKYGPGAFYRNLGRYIALSPPPTDEPRLLIWPEAAIPRTLDDRPELRRELATLLIGDNDLFLTGALKLIPGQDRDDPWAGLNSLYAIGPAGDIRARYDKQRLVPYGEYLPARPLLEAVGLSSFAPSNIDTLAGTGPRVLPLDPFAAVGAMICYETVYPEQASGAFRPGWLLNVSNDAWFSDGGAAMHLDHARLRSIEQGLPMARATPTGYSALIGPQGRVLERLDRHVAGTLRVRLPEPLPETLFARTGSALPLGLAVLMIGGALLIPRRGLAA
jgi:apolipoprotein N-acyltransferase